jgi:leucine dehydrogenase
MFVFDSEDFDGHEQVVFASDPDTGLKAIIAIHDTSNGPALGGCRMWNYATESEALRDVLRLSRGMTYKAAISRLPLGGGKSVIIGDARSQKTPELMRAMGRAVERLRGRYIVAEDVGTSVEDMAAICTETAHVVGRPADRGGSGDPSPFTAYGCLVGIRAALDHLGRADGLRGARVAIQGLGHVGWHLARLLAEAGARLIVSDIRPEIVERAVRTFGAEAIAVDEIHTADVDVFAPCALGAVINDRTIPALKARIVAGSANNQLAEGRHGAVLRQRGVLYAPDYVVNAGGLMNVAAELGTYDATAVRRRIEGIYDTLMDIFARADRQGIPTNAAADRIAEERFRRHRRAGKIMAA